jgi:hypothetical protein
VAPPAAQRDTIQAIKERAARAGLELLEERISVLRSVALDDRIESPGYEAVHTPIRIVVRIMTR